MKCRVLHFTAQQPSLGSKDGVRRKTTGSKRNRENW